jgi:hypothetical protein
MAPGLRHSSHGRFEVDLDDDRPIMPVSIITTMPDIEPWFRVTPLTSAT